MVPLPQVPRSAFVLATTHKSTFPASVLVPVFCEEVLPGDSWRVRGTMFARLQTLLFPIMDNIHLDSFWFFTPNRLVWENWNRFMGEQDNPDDSIDFLIPERRVNEANSGADSGTLWDYFGLPISDGWAPGATMAVSALPFRMYNLIYNQWFRDENLQDSTHVELGDGPDLTDSWYVRRNRGKRHDYFTSALPWPLKGGVDVTLPLTGTAPIRGLGLIDGTGYVANAANFRETDRSPTLQAYAGAVLTSNVAQLAVETENIGGQAWPTVFADLGEASSATINAIRTAIAVQQYLEGNARGGTRYTEILRARFGVASPDARLQRPEYLGGASTPIHVTPIAQTAPAAGGSGPLASLGATANVIHTTGFSQSFVEHGYVMCLVSVRADLTYQQGIARHWRRSTVYDFYAPEFAHLGEQGIRNQEIFAWDGSTQDEEIFGYTPRWEEYRHIPSKITGVFRSEAPLTLDAWHLSQHFTTVPTLGNTFISDPAITTINRVTAIDESSFPNQQFLFDSRYDVHMVRPLPTYSVPGLTRF